MQQILTTTIVLLCTAQPALAYIGPGTGAGLIATVMGILVAISLALFAVLWYPIKRLLRRNSKHNRSQ
jgi:biopolymer transport protein ExbB/TolQ